MYIYRAVDSQGNTIEFLLNPTRDAEAAKCFFSFETAWQTLQGFEVMNMIRKVQVQGVAKGDVQGQVALVARLFGG